MNIPKAHAKWLIRAIDSDTTRRVHATAIRIGKQTFLGVTNHTVVHALAVDQYHTPENPVYTTSTYIVDPSGEVTMSGIDKPFDWSKEIAQKYEFPILTQRPVRLKVSGKCIPWYELQGNRVTPYDLKQAFTFAQHGWVFMPTEDQPISTRYAKIGFGEWPAPFTAFALIPHHGPGFYTQEYYKYGYPY
jgi:hypothetical protein